MFTGIVTDVATIANIEEKSDGRLMRIETIYDVNTIDLGASIAHNGICLTVTEKQHNVDGKDTYDVFLGHETLRLTTAKHWQIGDKVNLERSLRLQDELGGHLVSGHVDGIAKIVSREDFSDQCKLVFDAPRELARFIATKGSIALNGTSLTVNWVEETQFSVLLIPHTLEVTNWHLAKAGDEINIEIDQMARYAARLIEMK
jgi:riboflavin synthase